MADKVLPGVRLGTESGGHALPVWYVTVQLGLLTVSAVLPVASVSGVLNLIAVTLGVGAFVVGLLLRRPNPFAGWWAVAASALCLLAAAYGAAIVYGLGGGEQLTNLVPAGLAALSLPLLALGLALLGRQRAETAADILDAAMLAVGGFLLLWAFLIVPELNAGALRFAAAVIYPIGVLLVVTSAFKLVLSGGLRDPAIRVLLLSVGVLVIISVGVLIPGLKTGALPITRPIELGWVIYGILLGGVGLHRDLATRRLAERGDPGALSPGRMVLFIALALIAPIALASELIQARESLGRSSAGITASLVGAALLLLLLVMRMALIAREAQKRADEVAQRSAALASAMEEQESLQRELSYRALHDPLTGLANRAVLGERLQTVLPAGTGPHALLLLDLDGFKDINDTLGHPVGDQLLVELAQRLTAGLPANALVARLGGDEFAILLEGADEAAARRQAEFVLDAVRRPFVIGGRELLLSTSIGLLLTGTATRQLTPSAALRDADLALYAAKGAGKNRVIVFEEHLRATRMDHARLTSGLRHALSHDELVLHYQPIVDLGTQRMVAVEALLRWHPPDGALVDSAAFVAVAEETGLIMSIGAWALRQACRDARRWHDGSGVLVSVNIANRQLDDPHFADVVLDALSAAGLPGTALVLELTEASLVASVNDEVLTGKLRRLRANGVRIAVDDFGTGFTSLSYVSSLPVDIVKVDRAFTQHRSAPASAPQTWAFTRAVLELIDGLKLLAVAEGIETPAQADALRALRFPYAQGYLFARPQPAEGIDAALAAERAPA